MSKVLEGTVARVREVYDPYLSMAEIARLVGVTHPTVRGALVELGLPTQRRYALPDPLPPVDPIWAAEFRGLFYGDGYAGMKLRSRPRPYGTPSPRLCIRQRCDNWDLLEEIQSVLGGRVALRGRENAGSHPQAAWEIYGFADCLVVIEATGLHKGQLPANKQRDVQILHEAILARYSMPRDTLTLEQKEVLWGYYDALKEIKRFNC